MNNFFINKLLCILCLAVTTWHASAQRGLLVEDGKYLGLAQLPAYSGRKYNEVPLKVSLRPYCPVPGDQGSTGACVGWATGYGALTIMRMQRARVYDHAVATEMANSAAFVYNQIKLSNEDCTAGAYIEDALALLRNTGDCLERTFNFEQQSCLARPDARVLQEAAAFRIRDYAAVFALDEQPKSKSAKACKILAAQTPIIVGLGVTQSFWDIRPGTHLWNPTPDEPLAGYHALVVIGYDNVERQFELMNSFGPGWGLGGFVKIPYDDFERLCRYAYVLIPGDGELSKQIGEASPETLAAEANSFTGEFVFRRPAGYLTTADGDELPWFEEVSVRWNSTTRLYAPLEGEFSAGDVFQLVAREIPRGRYAYVFSQNPDGRVNLHFPKISDAGKSAGFVLEFNAEIVIPSEESVLQLSAPGEDFLCILFSKSEITDFEERFARLQALDGNLPQRVDKVFGDLFPASNDVRYGREKMAFIAVTTEQNAAVPLILRVVAK
ncbi:MAG: C1 family peptidase [Saprospiraceae bacterium]|jgi:hypothetical protein|nr:C1 family peptidase [Saprospiraceae bacterium]